MVTVAVFVVIKCCFSFGYIDCVCSRWRGCVYVDWYCVYIWISGFDGCVVRLVLSGYDYDDSWIYLAMFEVILI